jgi:transposase
MRQRDKQAPQSAEETVRDIRRATRRHFSAEEKIRIVLDGLRGEDSIAELCRKEGIAQNLYYRWSKEFLEAGKKRLAGDTAREASSDEVKTLAEARQLKEALAEVTLENRLLKKSVIAAGDPAGISLSSSPKRRAASVSARGSSRAISTILIAASGPRMRGRHTHGRRSMCRAPAG